MSDQIIMIEGFMNARVIIIIPGINNEWLDNDNQGIYEWSNDYKSLEQKIMSDRIIIINETITVTTVITDQKEYNE